MNLISRRAFLQTTAMLPLAMMANGVLGSSLKAWAEDSNGHKRQFLLLCDTDNEIIYNNIPPVAVTNPGSVRAFDVASGEAFKVDLPFFGHTLSQNPTRPHQVVTLEKWGRRGALIDLNQKAVLTTIESSGNNVFFGHAAFVANGTALVTPEDTSAHTEGQLMLRDPSSLKTIQKMASYGLEPHDCRAVDNGKTIMVLNEGNTGVPGNVAWIEMASGKLLHKVLLEQPRPALNQLLAPSFEHMIYAHFDVSHDGWICTGGHPGTGADNSHVMLVTPEGRLIHLNPPADIASKLTGDTFSFAFLGKTDLFAVTIPKANLVLVWNYRTQDFVNAIEIHAPKGLLVDTSPSNTPEPSLIVSSSKDRDLIKVAMSSQGKSLSQGIMPAGSFGGNGSHLTRVYV